MTTSKDEFNITSVLNDLVQSINLDSERSAFVMEKILKGELSDSQLSAFITLLHAKGETSEEFYGLVKSMWDNMPDFSYEENEPTIDTCGTGGDHSNTFNISTVVALTLSAAGIKVAKHGNRAATSMCGAADVLEQMGIKIDLNPDECIERINKTNFTFLFAPTFHPGMRYAAPIRKSLGIRTTFNFLGPLSNPFKASIRMHGVTDSSLIDTYINTLKSLGVKRAYVFTGDSGLDEISLSGKTSGKLLVNGEIFEKEINPQDLAFAFSDRDQLQGGDAQRNAEIIEEISRGEKGPKRDIVILNSAVAYNLAKGFNLDEDLKQSIEIIEDIIDSGALASKITELKSN